MASLQQEDPDSAGARSEVNLEASNFENFQIISSQRGGRKLLFDGHIYIKKKTLSNNREKFIILGLLHLI